MGMYEQVNVKKIIYFNGLLKISINCDKFLNMADRKLGQQGMFVELFRVWPARHSNERI